MNLFIFILLVIPLVLSEKPECKHIDPIKSTKEWETLDRSDCNITKHQLKNDDEHYKYYDEGVHAYSFNVLTSDKIGPFREIPATYHERQAFEITILFFQL